MTYYFGFKPTQKLTDMINEAQSLVASGRDEPYYPLRNDISQQIGRELIDNLLLNLVSVIPDEERQAKLTKIVGSIESATETMLGILLGKDSNKEVLPNIRYLEDETTFADNDGVERVGFKLDSDKAKAIFAGFDSVTQDAVDKDKLQEGLIVMNHAVIDHFISRFSETLPLGLIKRKSVPVAKAGINKFVQMAIHKIFPQLPDESLRQVVDFYRPFIVEKD